MKKEKEAQGLEIPTQHSTELGFDEWKQEAADLKKHMDAHGKATEQANQEPSPDDLKIFQVVLNPIHLACLDDELKPNMRLIEIKNNIASATNGVILVKVDLSLTTGLTPAMLKVLNGKYIHMSVWAEICKCESLEVDDEVIVCHKSGINKMFEYSNPQGSFFSMNDIVEDIKLAGEEKKRIICYNSKLIATLSKIFMADNLNFSFSKGNKGTFVYPHYDCGMFAVLCPIEGNEAENRYFFL